MRLRSKPETMTPVAAISDHYLATPNRYGYEQILLLAFLGTTRRIPVTPLLAPLLRKILDSAANLVSQLTNKGREALICSEYVYRCYREAVDASDDPYEIAIAGAGERGMARAMRGVSAGRIERGSLLDEVRRGGSARSRGLAAKPRPLDRRRVEVLGEAYLASTTVRGARAAAPGGAPLADQVEPELMKFAKAIARTQRVRAGARGAGPPVATRLQAATAVARAVADFVTPGDLLKSRSLVALGQLDLNARAFQAAAARAPQPLTVKGSAMNKYALCIGINDYPGTQNDLSGCVNDANDWAKALRDRGFSVTQLLDKKATGQNIREAIKSVIARAKSGDVVAIQYSGHGSFVPDTNGDEPDGNDECICPYDITARGPIVDDELFQLYTSRQAGVHLVVFSDSCHSGTVARFMPILTPPTIPGRSAPVRRVRFMPPEVFLPKSQVARMGLERRALRRSSPPGRNGALLMAGCQDSEYSFDASFSGRPNGAFTYVALDSLKKLPKSASYIDWFQKIRKILPSQQYAQTPNLFGASNMKKWKVLG
jgi:hypothetical protein